jgi:hypothetical protein
MNLQQNSFINFVEETHTYTTPSGVVIQGLTTLLKKHGIGGYSSSIPAYILENAKNKGIAIHLDCQTGELFGEYKTQEGANFGKLKIEHDFSVLQSEYLVSDNNTLATFLDDVIIKENQLCIADIKTTYSLDKNYISWQLSIGAYLFHIQNPDLKIKKLYAIWLRGDKKEMVEIPFIPDTEIKRLLECEANDTLYTQPIVKIEDETQNAISLLAEVEVFIQENETLLKKLKETKEAYTSIISKAMIDKGVKSWDTETMKITVVDATVSKTFDSKTFLAEHKEFDVAQNYKTTNKSGYLKITLK